jgi:hypothetical protein
VWRTVTVLASAVLAFAGAAHAAEIRSVALAPAEDVSMPFWCDWGYDWDERCYRLDGARLGVGGGEPDKVWRSALRFSTSAIPSGATVVTAELSLWYDRTCVAPRTQSKPCDGRGFDFGLHPIFTPSWSAEREVEYGPQVGFASLDPSAPAQWVVWDVTRPCRRLVVGRPPEQRLAREARRREGGLRCQRAVVSQLAFGEHCDAAEADGVVPAVIRRSRVGTRS